MYQIGDFVVYGIHGVCRILDIEDRKIDKKLVSYYVLEPTVQSETRYMVPVQNEIAVGKMRPILTREELNALLHSPQIWENAWVSEENQRKQLYRELITSGDREALLRMVCTLYQHKEALASAGKKFHLCDENFLRDAERLLSSEISLVLQIEQSQVGAYVLSAMQMEK